MTGSRGAPSEEGATPMSESHESGPVTEGRVTLRRFGTNAPLTLSLPEQIAAPPGHCPSCS